MPTNANDIIRKLPPSQRAKVETRAAQLIAEEMDRRVRVTKGSGNVFADLGLPNPKQELLKAQLLVQIFRTIKHGKFGSTQVGKILGLNRTQTSSLLRGQPENFSVKRLKSFLAALGARQNGGPEQSPQCGVD